MPTRTRPLPTVVGRGRVPAGGRQPEGSVVGTRSARPNRSRTRTTPSLADRQTLVDDVSEMTRTDCVDITVCTNGVLTYDEIGGHLRPAGTGSVEIDLTGLKFIDPAGLVRLAVIAERATLLHRPVRFRKPEGGDVANY